LLEALELEDPEDLQYRLDALTTSFLDAGLVPKKKLRRLKFHAAIEFLTIPLKDGESLALEMETFEDLINAYGDEPSEDEMDEAKDILEKVTEAIESPWNRRYMTTMTETNCVYERINEDSRN